MNTRLITLVVALSLLIPSTGFSYVCTRVVDAFGEDTGPSLSWFSRQVTFLVHADGTEDLEGTEEFEDLEESFRVWQALNMGTMTPANCGLSGTTDIEFVPLNADDGLESVLTDETRVGFNYLDQNNNNNLVIFHDDNWPHVGQSSLIIALTTTTYNPLTGEIFDADIEFNTQNFPYSGTQDETATDLMNATVHEVGHMLGLGHTDLQEATMFPRAETGEILKRDLACDDVAGILFKYPAGEPNGYCTPDAECGFCAPPQTLTKIPTVSVASRNNGEGGCAATGTSLTTLLGLLGLLALRRRTL